MQVKQNKNNIKTRCKNVAPDFLHRLISPLSPLCLYLLKKTFLKHDKSNGTRLVATYFMLITVLLLVHFELNPFIGKCFYLPFLYLISPACPCQKKEYLSASVSNSYNLKILTCNLFCFSKIQLVVYYQCCVLIA